MLTRLRRRFNAIDIAILIAVGVMVLLTLWS